MWQGICKEPYRIFFPIGGLVGIIGVSHWLLYALGLTPEYSVVYHSSVQSQVYVGLFIFGFLTTAGPRFAGAPPATPREVGIFLALFLALYTGLARRAWIFSDLCSVLLLIRLLVFLGKRFKGRGYRPPAEFVWVAAGIFCGLAGALLSAASHAGFMPAQALSIGKLMKEQGLVLFVVLGVGGFLSPRLLGISGLLSPNELRSVADAQKWRQRRIWIHLAAAVGLLVSFVLEGTGHIRLAYALRALIVTSEIMWMVAIYRLPAVSEHFAWLLWHALWMVVLGYWACAIWPMHVKAMLHLVYIGGFSLMIMAVATMVIFNHAGEAEKLKKPSWMLRIAALGIFLAITFRVAAVLFATRYFLYLGVAATFWLLAGFCWLGLVAPRLMRHVRTESDHC